ncbi:HEPN domain-containing protein [Candidatus Woesearchaeota archaeon]|nr:HEPN domain-containing protein [Candidatus Woesearchaeota archaeon]
MKEEVKRWWRMAKDDIDAAEYNFQGSKFYLAAFMCQQAVEKALKALVIENTGKLLKIHDLVILGKKVNLPEHLLEKCDKLNGVYLDARYGDLGSKLPSEKFNKPISSELLDTAKGVLAWLEKNI